MLTGLLISAPEFKLSRGRPSSLQPPTLPLCLKQDAKKDPPFGADVLRLWVSSVDYSSDVLIGGRIISQVGLHINSCAVSQQLPGVRWVVWWPARPLAVVCVCVCVPGGGMLQQHRSLLLAAAHTSPASHAAGG